MIVLSLDIATKTGFCTDDEWGLWNCTPKRDESKGMRNLKFEAFLKEMLDKKDIKLVTYERVAGAHQASTNVASQMVGVLTTELEKRDIDYAPYSAMTIKKFATGNGHASKNAMIAAAREKYGYEGFDDNVADAIHLYHYTYFKLKL